jgi:hypothetical protein
MKKTKRLNLVVVTVAVLLGCVFLALSGQSSIAGIQGSGRSAAVAIGRITGFGSIFVDGVEYATSGAQIVVDGQSASEAQLQVGQIVTVTGTLESNDTAGTASVVSFTGNAEGPISQIDVANHYFVVLGQIVIVTGDTTFGVGLTPGGLGALRNGTTVIVSAFANAAGDLVASRIDSKLSGPAEQVGGQIHGLDTNARTFRINSLTIDYSGIAAIGSLTDGVTATVQGVESSTDGVLYATQVQVASGSIGSPNELGKIEGLITTFNSASDFTVGSQRVSTTPDTHFVLHGQSLGENVGVSVQGSFNTSGALVAKSVQTKTKVN